MTRNEIKIARLELVVASAKATVAKAEADMVLSQQRKDNATARLTEASNEIAALQAKLAPDNVTSITEAS